MVDPAAGSDIDEGCDGGKRWDDTTGAAASPGGDDAQAIADAMRAELERTSQALHMAMERLQAGATDASAHVPAQRSSQPRQLTVMQALLPPVAMALVACLSSVLLGLVDVPLYIPHVLSPVSPLESGDVLNPSDFIGRYALTTAVTASNSRRLLDGLLLGPEHVEVASRTKRLWVSSTNGSLLSVALRNDEQHVDVATLREEVYAGPGRILGFAVLDDENATRALLCNSLQGLMEWSSDTGLRVLSNRVSATSAVAPGALVQYANALAVSRETGDVYFTTSTDVPPVYDGSGYYSTFRGCVLTGYAGRKTGKVLRFNERTGETECLLDGLWFANGVALSPSEDFLLVVETLTLSVWKLWLKGPKDGQMDVVLRNLPAFPDNLHANADGTFFVGLVSRPAKLLTTPLFRSKSVRAMLAYLPPRLTSALAAKGGGALRFDGDGTVLDFVGDERGQVLSSTPSVVKLADSLYFGHLEHNYVTAVDVLHA